MGTKFNPFSGTFDIAFENADEIKYDNSTSGLTATDAQAALDEIDGTLDSHLDGGAGKHDLTEIDYERIDGSKKNIQASSDDGEAAITDLDDAIGSQVQGTNYTASNSAIVASHLSGIDTELGNLATLINNWEWQESALDYITDNTLVPPTEVTGDRYVLSHDGGAPNAAWDGASAGDVVEFDGSVWTAVTPTTGMMISIDDETTSLRQWGGSSWVQKFFESTTASGFLSMSSFDVQLTNLSDQNIIMGNGSNVATSVNLSAVGDINGTTAGGLTIKTGVIVDSMVNASAAIQFSKMENLTIDRALVSDGSGDVSVSAVTATELGYVSGVTSAIQTQLDSKTNLSTLTTKGDLYVRDASGVTRQAIGADNQVLVAEAAQANGMKWEVLPAYVVSSVSGTFGVVSGTTYLVDTSGGVATANLPAPAANTWIRIKDSGFNANTNNITVARNGSESIENVAGNFTLDSDGEQAVFVSDGTDWFRL